MSHIRLPHVVYEAFGDGVFTPIASFARREEAMLFAQRCANGAGRNGRRKYRLLIDEKLSVVVPADAPQPTEYRR